MKLLYLTLVLAVAVTGCTAQSTKSPDVTASVRASLDQARLGDVTVSDDVEKGVVTLGGHVAADGDKETAGSIARSAAGQQVVANQVGVRPPGLEKDASTVGAELDKGIEHNLDAALIQNGLHDQVTYGVVSGVVTLNGEVNSPGRRRDAAMVASAVPNVTQVVNELQVKDQKATSR